MPLKHAERCVYCGGKDWVPDRHWMVCAICHPAEAQRLRRENFKPTLLDKGIPGRRPM